MDLTIISLLSFHIRNNFTFHGMEFIGSSNLSQSALIQGVEWNICIDSSQTPSAFLQACSSFSHLFEKTTTLGLSWEGIALSFLLGLTATPERSDGRDIEALCDNNVAFRFDLTEAIEAGRLCPFTYFGIHDRHVDYESIPWRSRRFDPAEIETAFETQARALQIFDEWKAKGQSRTLGFCVGQSC